MAYICEKCGKGKLTGHNVSHAKNRTQKFSNPNLHRASFGRGLPSMRLCTTCLREMTARKAKARVAVTEVAPA